MNKIHNYFELLRIKINEHFNLEYYIIFNLLTAILSWKLQSYIGMYILLSLAIFSIAITNDLVYSIPCLLFLLFSNNIGFSASKFPTAILILIVLIFISLLIYFIKNKCSIRKAKSSIGLIGLGLISLIPLIWFIPNNDGFEIFTFIYLSDLCYLILYLLFASGIKKNSIIVISKTFSYLSVLISLELILKALDIASEVDNFFHQAFYIGWGYCNEAGIMICFFVPFIFYLISFENKLLKKILYHLFILLSIVGLILTTSRGSYLFGFIEILVCYIVLFIKSPTKKKNLKYIIPLVILSIIFIICCRSYLFSIFKKIYDAVFILGIDSNGRFNLWKEAYDIYTNKIHYIFFGAGYCAIIRETLTSTGIGMGQVVFHSTIFETLIIGGIIGLGFLLYHLFEKYRACIKRNDIFYIFVIISYLFVDAYGLIDNTYHMYYYMIPLVILMACIDSKAYNIE